MSHAADFRILFSKKDSNQLIVFFTSPIMKGNTISFNFNVFPYIILLYYSSERSVFNIYKVYKTLDYLFRRYVNSNV